jgi:hypothetical protein
VNQRPGLALEVNGLAIIAGIEGYARKERYFLLTPVFTLISSSCSKCNAPTHCHWLTQKETVSDWLCKMPHTPNINRAAPMTRI